jgi:hypothetical protein
VPDLTLDGGYASRIGLMIESAHSAWREQNTETCAKASGILPRAARKVIDSVVAGAALTGAANKGRAATRGRKDYDSTEHGVSLARRGSSR